MGYTRNVYFGREVDKTDKITTKKAVSNGETAFFDLFYELREVSPEKLERIYFDAFFNFLHVLTELFIGFDQVVYGLTSVNNRTVVAATEV